jgi:large subunit ribosomal protein L9
VEVILLERIEKLGQMGDVVTVKSGYARNFLLPRKKALRATKGNLSHFEAQRAQLEAENLSQKGDAESVSTKMEGAKVVVIRQAGEAGQLYGSVSARDIASGLTEASFTTDRRQVVIAQPIKEIGIHSVQISLHPEVSIEVFVNVARSTDEAAIQQGRSDRGEEPVVSRSEREAEEDFVTGPVEVAVAADADADSPSDDSSPDDSPPDDSGAEPETGASDEASPDTDEAKTE